MKFAILGLLVVLLIGFFVVVWKAAKDWRWYNIVAVCITMLLAVAFLFPTAGVLKSRSEWHKVKEALEVQAAQVEAEYRVIKYGDLDNPEAGEGVIVLDQKLSKLGIEAGRRWRNLQMTNVANNQITLVQQQIAPPPVAPEPPAEGEGEEAAAPPPQPLIPDGLVVYGFAETPNQQQVLIPTFYLGEFLVSAPTPSQVIVTPTEPLEQNQIQAISSQQARVWSLFELLPLDGHAPFVAEGSEATDENALGRVDEDLVRQLIGKVSPETLNNYLRDGNRSTQDDPPLSRWTKIEFVKTHTIQVDSPDQRGALDGGFFDGNGRAVDGRLQISGEEDSVTFKKEDQILVKEEAANQLIDEGAARLVDRYYLRPLNDYRFVLRRIRMRLTELASRTTELEFEKKVLEEAVKKTEGMIVTNQVIKDKLEQDRDQFRVEKSAIEDYTGKLQQRVDKMRAEMIRLHRENIELEQKLEQKHRAIEQRLDAVTMAP